MASTELKGIHVEHAIGYYGLLIAGVWRLSKVRVSEPEATRLRTTPLTRVRLLPAGVMAVVFALASCLVWLTLTVPPAGRLSVTFLDVGQGDAILIEGPAGHRVLVDGGPSGEVINAAMGRHLPFYDRRIDLIVLTHPQADHLGGLPTVLEQYDVGGALSGAAGGEGAAYQAWVDALRSEHVPQFDAFRGHHIDLGGDAWISVLGPGHGSGPTDEDELNDASVVLRLEMGSVSFLLTGDIGAEGEAALIRAGAEIESTVLKVAHHGSRTSTSPEFLRRIRPIIDVISVGEKNRFGHPTDEVLERLVDDLVLRTDIAGDITLSTDGSHLWLETQRGSD